MGTLGRPRVVVVGSINMDIVNRVIAFPRPGETVRALGTEFHPGGKGANQAVAAAAAAAGGDVAMIGALGVDPFAATLREALRAAGVRAEAVAQKAATSGQAAITVDALGQNAIVLAAGANALLSPEDVEAHAGELAGARTLLVQNEIPWETTVAAMRLARECGARVVCNPAPARALSAEVYALVDTLIVNEIEAGALVGREIASGEAAEAAARELAALGPRVVIVTLGERGAVLHDAGDGGCTLAAPAFTVRPVDTTGAGDTFIGFYAVASLSAPAEEALRRAMAAAAISITRPGAQEAVPTAAEVEAFLRGESWP